MFTGVSYEGGTPKKKRARPEGYGDRGARMVPLSCLDTPRAVAWAADLPATESKNL